MQQAAGEASALSMHINSLPLEGRKRQLRLTYPDYTPLQILPFPTMIQLALSVGVQATCPMSTLFFPMMLPVSRYSWDSTMRTRIGHEKIGSIFQLLYNMNVG